MIKRLAILISLTLNGWAAGPMTHLYLGEKYCDAHHFSEEEKEAFLVGTLFPDIRYITHLPREQTHPPTSSLMEVREGQTPFEQGVHFHVWVDNVREEFAIQSGIYEKIIPYADGHPATLLKFIEEEILGGFYDPLPYSYIFSTPFDEELLYATSQQVYKWHMMIQLTMRYSPSWLIWGLSYLKEKPFGISNQTLYNWSFFIPECARSEEFQDYVQQMIVHLSSYRLQ